MRAGGSIKERDRKRKQTHSAQPRGPGGPCLVACLWCALLFSCFFDSLCFRGFFFCHSLFRLALTVTLLMGAGTRLALERAHLGAIFCANENASRAPLGEANVRGVGAIERDEPGDLLDHSVPARRG